MPAFLARHCNGTRQTRVYELSEPIPFPTAWRFNPTGIAADGERTGSDHFLIRQGGVAAVANSASAAVALLETVP
jgi:hypothetical protein